MIMSIKLFSSIYIVSGPLNEKVKIAITELCAVNHGLHPVEPTHVSLSKTFILKYHWIENFFDSLRNLFAKPEDSTSQFILSFSSVVYFSNEEKTRYFACLSASDCYHNILNSAIRKVDCALKEFKLPVYYEEPSFHCSILWKLEDFTQEEKRQITSKLNYLIEYHQDAIGVCVDKIFCKTGNKTIEIPL